MGTKRGRENSPGKEGLPSMHKTLGLSPRSHRSHRPIILALGRQQLEDLKFEVIFGYIANKFKCSLRYMGRPRYMGCPRPDSLTSTRGLWCVGPYFSHTHTQRRGGHGLKAPETLVDQEIMFFLKQGIFCRQLSFSLGPPSVSQIISRWMGQLRSSWLPSCVCTSGEGYHFPLTH